MYKQNTFSLIIVLALAVYTITAFNSHGYYHADEHYQIIEFAGLKLGTHSHDDLAWEYKSQIRQGIQPIVCFVIFKAFSYININDPYDLALLLRLLSAIFAIGVTVYFIKQTRTSIDRESDKTVYYLLSFFLWFIPVISVRFSSETWSGIIFLLSLAIYLNDSNAKSKPFFIGMTLGLSFLFRFQIAFAILGFGLWMLIIERLNVKHLMQMFSSFILIVFLGFIIDSWFYGELVFTPWKYFSKAIIEEPAFDFGTSPWYFYIEKLLRSPSYFMGVPIILSFVILTIAKPKNHLIWCALPFIIGHSFFSHKEERFLFPIIYLIPIMLTKSYILINKLIVNHSFRKGFNYLLFAMFFSINSIGLIAMGQKSAGLGRMEITKYIHEKYGNQRINLIFSSWANPYDPWHGLPTKFYMEGKMSHYGINNLCELEDSSVVEGAVNLLVILKAEKENVECVEEIANYNFDFEKQSIPKWIERVNTDYQGFDNRRILELYRLRSN